MTAPFSESALRHLPTLVSLLLAAALAMAGVRLVQVLRPVQQEPPSASEAAVSRQPNPVERLPSAKDIAGWHLFGAAPAQERAAPAPITAPDTKLDLKLRGIVASTEAGSARAIIEDSTGRQSSYGLGDQLPGSALLREIHPVWVILERNQRYETLRMPKDELPDETGPQPAQGPVGFRAPAVPPARPAVSAALQQYRQRLLDRRATDAPPAAAGEAEHPAPAQ